jgi:hypothetical protein
VERGARFPHGRYRPCHERGRYLSQCTERTMVFTRVATDPDPALDIFRYMSIGRQGPDCEARARGGPAAILTG